MATLASVLFAASGIKGDLAQAMGNLDYAIALAQFNPHEAVDMDKVMDALHKKANGESLTGKERVLLERLNLDKFKPDKLEDYVIPNLSLDAESGRLVLTLTDRSVNLAGLFVHPEEITSFADLGVVINPQNIPTGYVSAWFANAAFSGLTTLDGLENLSRYVSPSTFKNYTSLVDASAFDFSGANGSASNFFQGCTSLTTVSDNLDTSKVNATYLMFDGCTNLTSVPTLDLGSINREIDMGGMFQGCSSLQSVSFTNVSSAADNVLSRLETGNKNDWARNSGITTVTWTTKEGVQKQWTQSGGLVTLP